MPCYTVKIVSVEFKAHNGTALLQAIKALEWNYQTTSTPAGTQIIETNGIIINLSEETADFPANRQSLVNTLKREYSVTTINNEAKKRGFVVKWNEERRQAKLIKY